ncbi:MAG: SRPBCC family protein [Saprospiraceae bacterium]|nr:SRPBCC family protein [Saprospiraceae bacterium]
MFRFHLETEINKPLDQVTRLFTNRDLLPKWQPGLLSSEQIENYPFPKYKLLLSFGRRKMVMMETITRHELPFHFEGTYEMKGVFNRMVNTFEASGPQKTRWICESEFRFTGLMKIIAFFMKDGFRDQSRVIMENFKRFAEKEIGGRN